MLAGMQRELTFHPEIQLLVRDAQGSSRHQQQHILQLLQAGVDVLLVAPSEEAVLAPALAEARRRGIPVVLLDHRTSSAPYTAYVGGDNTHVGAAAARYAAQLLRQQGQVVEIVGWPATPVTTERHQGFVRALQAYPGMPVVGQVTGDWRAHSLQPALTALLRAHPRVKLIFAHSDLMAQGASEVCRRLGLTHVRIIGVDGLAGPGNGMEMVQQGRSTASLFYPPGGEEAVRVALKLLHHQPYERENILGTIVIDSTNVLTMLQQEAKLASQQQGIEQQQHLLRTLQATYASQRTGLYVLLLTLLTAVGLGISAWRAARANRRTNRQLSRQNEEIRAQRNQIAAMAEQAQAQNEAKLRFFTNFSHELRTPLTLIMGPVEELLRADPSTALLPAQRQELDLVRRNTHRLLQLVNQLLDFRKAEGGKMTVQARADDFVPFVRELVETFEPAARVQHLTLAFEPAEPTLPGWFDRNVLDKVLVNLLANALKYTPAGGRVAVTLQAVENDRAQVQVTDTGVGIAPQDQAHIFEWFYQGEQSGGSKGSGMGLALAHGLTRLHQGQLSFTSRPGQGSTFVVTLPRELPQALRSPDPPVFTEKPAPAEPVLLPAEAGAAEPADATPLVLVVEDNADVNEFVARMLRPHYRVRTAADGAAGLQLATELLPDLIVCDVMMPGLSGLEVVARLRADWRSSHIPVILLTARIAPEQQVEGAQAGADLYLTKPFSPALLLESVRTLLANRAYQREHTRRQLLADQPPLAAPVGPDPTQQFIADLTDIIEARLTQTSLTVEEVAQQLHLTRTQLYRKVKAVLGTSVTDYIQHVRLRKARELLLGTSLTVTAVAYEVGYTSHSYFSNSFKARYKVSPSEFRAQCLAPSA
jgi:signal transduction histidine kinase/DNA-binding response OmpR family regulator